MINYLIDFLGIDLSVLEPEVSATIQVALVVVGSAFALYLSICFFKFILQLLGRR